MNKNDYLELWTPSKPLASDDIKTYLYEYWRKEALNMRWVSTSHPAKKNLLVLDYDVYEAEYHIKNLIEDEVIPEYNYITINPQTTHAQVGYFIDGFAHTPKAQGYFNDLHKKFKVASKSDVAYANNTMRNPLNRYQTTGWGTSHLYTLKEIEAFCRGTEFVSRTTELIAVEGMRNEATFEALRKWAYTLRVKLQFSEDSFFELAVAEKAAELNASLEEPLPLNEVYKIAKSVYNWVMVRFNATTFKQIQAARAKKRWGNQGEDTAMKMLAYREAGFKIREIAEAENMTVNAVKQALHRAKSKGN